MRATYVWSALALLNIAAGAVVSTQPQRVTDLETVMDWGRAWLIDGQNIYFQNNWTPDYPPLAIVLLSPLALLPMWAAVPVWVIANVAMIAGAGYLAARFLQPLAPAKSLLVPILMFATWGGARTLTQFSLLALTLSMAALAFADRRPRWSGLCLGLSLMKPQVAIPVFLWAMFTGRFVLVLRAVAVGVLGVTVFCWWSRADPILLTSRYLGILGMYHTREPILVGISDLRPLIRALSGNPNEVDAIAASIALGLLSAICVSGFLEARSRHRWLYAAPPMVACWSLLTFYHLTYGFVILLPAFMLLAIGDIPRSTLRIAILWILQVGLMFDIPGISRRLGLLDSDGRGPLLAHADRFLMLGLLAGFIVLAWNERPASEDLRPGR